MKQTETLSTKKRAALRALLSGLSLEDAASVAGVSRVSLWRWLQEPAFNAELQRLEADALQAVSRRLLTLATGAADVLEKALQDSKATIRLRAAALILERLAAYRQAAELERRLEALEAAVSGREEP